MRTVVFLLPLILLFLPSCQEANGGSAEDPEGGNNEEPLQQAVEELANDPSLKKGRVSFLARELNRGSEEAAHRPEEGIVPASTQKLVTTISALNVLGPEHRFRTVLGYQGKIEGSVLKGDLIVRGGGDPAFLSEEFPEHYGTAKTLFDQWLQACKQAGIEKIKGRLLIDARYFPYNTLSRGRIWEDMGNYFAAFPSGMNIMDNAFELRFRTQEEPGKKTQIIDRKPKTPWLEIDNRVKSSELQKDEAYIFGKPYDTERIVEGSLPAGRSSYSIEGAMPDPARTTAWMIHERFEKKGVDIENGFSSYRREEIREGALEKALDTIYSPRSKEIVERTNFESKNLFAETLLLETAKTLGAKAKPLPAGKAVLEQIEKLGVDAEGIRLADGSGLAPTNRLTASFLVALLEKAWKGEHRLIIRNSLPVAGKSGTMSYIGAATAAEGRIWAKSGYMEGVLGYAGYAKDKDGVWKAFALIANDHTGSASSMRRKMEPILVNMVE